MYRAPQQEIRFLIRQLVASECGRSGLSSEYSDEVIDSVLDEASRFAERVLAPLNRAGDLEGARWTAEGVRAPRGFPEAYREFVQAGWPQISAETRFGGQHCPHILNCAIQEIWASANVAFKLCAMLTQAAVETLQRYGSPAQQQLYLPKLVSGAWTGTMALTESQAGSDLSLIRTRATPGGDHYRLIGQKIFITWGDHDLAENIIHFVLARIDGAPPGVKGISLFLVPKILTAPNGDLGEPNDLSCISIEHKLGIHASPTCTLSLGEGQGAKGFLIGEAHRGLEYMFTMMNAARLAIGVEGYALAERAYQQALVWASTRRQGSASAKDKSPVPIAAHPDVRRMLLTMSSGTRAMRALTLYTALQLDLAHAETDRADAGQRQARADLLIPIVKGWCTEFGNELVAIAIQVHGGMGYIEETGVAQTLRDARINTIYEGTTGIQASDLLRRKLQRDRGTAMYALIHQMAQELHTVSSRAAPEPIAAAANEALTVLRDATHTILTLLERNTDEALAVSVPYLHLCGYTISGWLMARLGVASISNENRDEHDLHAFRVRTALFYAAHLLPRAFTLGRIVTAGAASVTDTDANLFAHMQVNTSV